MLTYAIYTTSVFGVLVAVFLVADWLAARWERRERDLWDKAFGGRGYAAPVAEERRDG